MNNPEPRTLIIIEDEDDIRKFYADIFRDAGYNVLEASEGESGLDLMKKETWDVLLLDIMLPDKDGMHLLEAMQDEPEIRKGLVIMLTNLNSEPVIKESFALGADGYLVKAEVSPDKIVSEVEQFFS